MAHPEQRRFIELVNEYLLGRARQAKVVEIGSYDVTGTIRDIFKEAESYVGADLVVGPGVDIVKSGEEVDLESASQDLALSCECFEHNPRWFETFQNMIRMTKAAGLVVFTCGSRGRVEHGTDRTGADLSPGTSSLGWNYYMNLEQSDFENRMKLSDHFKVYRFYYIPTHADLFFFGFKNGANPPEFDLGAFEAEVARIPMIEQEKFKHWGIHKRAVRRMSRVPLEVASRLLNDRAYQNFAVPYVKLRDATMQWVGWKM